MADVRPNTIALGLLAALGVIHQADAAEPAVRLHQSSEVGSYDRVIIELKASGISRPAPSPGAEKAKGKANESKPLKLRVETRFAFDERVLDLDSRKAPRHVVRRVIQAAAAINGEVRPTASSLRPEVALLVATIRDGSVLTYSLGGPLMRSELELVEGPGDPLALGDLLPEKPVAVGDHWPVGPLTARSLSSYDALAANALAATLESLDDAKAVIVLKGEIRGAALGGEGKIACKGTAVFDRKSGRVVELDVERSEDRKPGPVEAGLEIKSTLTMKRQPAETPPPELAADVLARVKADVRPEDTELLFQSIDGKYSLRHGRHWHLFADDMRQTVFKWLDHGELVAQCNLSAGPKVGKGRHQDLSQFRADIKGALAGRYGREVEAGEVEGLPEGGFRYRVAVEGHEGNVGVLWYYYLVASPEGDQLLGAFTVGEGQLKQFDAEDLRLVGSLQWRPEGEPSLAPGAPVPAVGAAKPEK